MARKIPHRELRNNSSRVLREVQEGSTVEITNHGEVVAILGPPSQRSRSLPLRPARAHGGFAALARARLTAPIQESIDDLRGER